MSMPNIPDISPTINLDRDDVINLLLASVALEEIGLGHILNAEGEKLQAVLAAQKCKNADISVIRDINESVERTVNGIARMQMMLQMKMENIMRFTTTTTSSTTSSSTSTTHSSCTRSTTATHTATKTCSTSTRSSTTGSTCAPPTTPCRAPGFRLAGYGVGYMIDEQTGKRCGVARLKTVIDAPGKGLPRNTLRYKCRKPSANKPQTIELVMIPSSLHTEALPAPLGEKDGYLVTIRGTGILAGTCVPSDMQYQENFCLQAIGMGKKLVFRMKLDLPDSEECHDSGYVTVVSGDLSLETA